MFQTECSEERLSIGMLDAAAAVYCAQNYRSILIDAGLIPEKGLTVEALLSRNQDIVICGVAPRVVIVPIVEYEYVIRIERVERAVRKAVVGGDDIVVVAVGFHEDKLPGRLFAGLMDISARANLKWLVRSNDILKEMAAIDV